MISALLDCIKKTLSGKLKDKCRDLTKIMKPI
jgi:hypothetical protein